MATAFVMAVGARNAEDRPVTQHLYIGSHGYVAAIDPDTGTEVWRTKLKTGTLSSTTHQDVTVLDHEKKVFAGCNGHLFCLEAGSGAILWHNQLEGLGYNDVTLTIAGKSVQTVTKVVHHSN